MRAKLQSLFIGAVVAMLAVLGAPAVRAQTAASTFVQAAAFTFDLPAQPLADSLRAVASVTRINIVFDPNVVAGMQAPPLKGSATARDALRTLLAGTGLRSVSVSAGTIRISRITAHDRIAAGAATGSSGSSGTATIPAATSLAPGTSAPVVAAAAASADPPAGPESTNGDSSTQPPAGQDDVSRAQLSEVVVTGTRIAGVKPASPLITLGRTEIDESGYGSVGQILLSLPENFSGGQNPGVIGARGSDNGTITGATSPDLMGLGADSTLTLVDGHRLAYDGFQNGVDLSLIPLAAVDRIEIMTDGASAIYGSDAVAGVVNVILKQHYEGVTADARYGDVTSGQAAQSQYSVLAGHDWGSGNALIAYEYSHDDALYASERPFSLAAEQPTTLYPELNRSSVFLTAHQSLSDSITASVDALYTRRSDMSVVTTGPVGAETLDYADTGVTEYGVSPEVSFSLPGDWNLSLDGTFSHDRDAADVPDVSAATGQLVSPGLVYYQNDMRLGQLEAAGTAFQLPSGPVRMAAGIGYRYEGFDNVKPLDSTEPVIHASRNVRYGYAELDLPVVRPRSARLLLERLNLTAAYRFEHYSDFGAQSTPKIGIAYVPVRSLRIRATWSKAFRAPELNDLYSARQLYLFPSQIFGAAPGSVVMFTAGANPALRPETATSKTVGLDFSPSFLPGLKISPTYFNVDYSHRIVEPIDNISEGLVNPIYAPFVVPSPALAEQAALVAQATLFRNYSGAAYDPAEVADLVENVEQNAESQEIHGVDLTARDTLEALGGKLSMTANGVWLTVRQRTLSTEPQIQISGTIFNPPSFKGRGSVTWRRGGWALSAAYNYVDSESDNQSIPPIHVGSWNTVDAQLAYEFDNSSPAVLHQLKISISVQNLFDRYPPFVAASATTYPGLGYDSTNASPFGRFIGAYVSKRW